MDWSQVTSLTIPEGNVKQVSVNGVVLWRKSLLPSGYTQLEYIESTGTQRIDTNISGNARWVITAQANSIKGDSQVIISSTIGAVGGTWYGESTNSRVWGAGGTALSDIPPTTKTTADLTFNNSGVTGTIGGISVVRNITATQQIWSIFATSSKIFPFIGKLFEATVYQNGTMVRNLIPAMRNSDSKVGMYDTVTRQFFTNAGTGEFIAGDFVLPKGYTKLEYLQSDATAYIDTGIAGGVDTLEVGCTFSYSKSVSYGAVYGNYVDDYHDGTRMILESISQPDIIITNINTICTTTGNTNASCAINEIHNVVNSYDTVTVDGTVTTKTEKTKGKSNYNNIALFNRSITNPNTLRDIGLRVYSFYIKNNDELVCNLVPCRRNSDNVLGMYDIVRNIFLTNVGTGEFIAGGAV